MFDVRKARRRKWAFRWNAARSRLAARLHRARAWEADMELRTERGLRRWRRRRAAA